MSGKERQRRRTDRYRRCCAMAAVGRTRPGRPAGPRSQRAPGEAWRNVPTTESGERRASSVARSDAQASTASSTSVSARSRGLRPPSWVRGGFGWGPNRSALSLVMRSLQRSQANVGQQSSRKSMRSKTLAPPSGTEEYPFGAVPTHVQTTFLRGGRAAELYLAFRRCPSSWPANRWGCGQRSARGHAQAVRRACRKRVVEV